MKKIWGTLDPFFEPGPILGRKVANGNFLKFLLLHDYFDEYHFFLPSPNIKDYVQNFLEENFPLSIVKKVKLFLKTQLHHQIKTNSYFCFHLSDCINYPQYLSSFRNFWQKDFPITSITHSLNYNNFIYSYLSHLTSSWSPQDVIISTSYSGKKVLKNFYRHLQQHLGIKPELSPPKIKVIPLGVEEKFFTYKENKLNIRQKLGLPLTSTLLLYLGRLSHSSKMDIIPLLRALKQAQDKLKEKIPLVLAGQVNFEEKVLETYQKIANFLNLDIYIFTNISEEEKINLLNAADIFLSLVDNYQETFGLSILEAKASSLCVLASDFDGYKELIKNEEDGFLISTYAPENNLFLQSYSHLLSDNQNDLLLSQNVGFDYKNFMDTLLLVIKNKELRRTIGNKAQKNAQKYLWSKIILKYIKLWEELNEQKVINKEVHPLSFSTFKLFDHYPTTTLKPEQILRLSSFGHKVLAQEDTPSLYLFLEDFISLEQVNFLLQNLSKPKSLHHLIQILKSQFALHQEEGAFLIFWCLKQGLIEKIY